MVDQGIAGVYTRQSKGRTKSIGDQEAEGRKACERESWTVAEVYQDTVGASRQSGKTRPGWDRLLADLEARRFGVLVMWESSRGDRVAETWLGLLRRCREAGVLIHVVSHDRTYDMSKGRDWKTLAEEGVDAEDETNKLSERIRRGTDANAVEGRPHGRVAYGFERIYDEKTRKLREQRADLKTAPIVREIVSRLAAGEPVSAVTNDLNSRRVPSPAGSKWYRSQVTKIALNPAYIGKRVFKGQQYDATWPALVSEAEHYAAVRRLSDPTRKTTRPGRRRTLLAALAVCGECGGPVRVSYVRERLRYSCPVGCFYAPMDAVDEHVGYFVRAELYRPEWRQFVAQQASTDLEAVRARAEADRLQRELDDLAKMLGEEGVTARTLAIAEAASRPKIDALRQRAAGASYAGIPSPDDILASWGAMNLHQRREVISLVCERVAVHKAAKRGRQAWDGERVEFTFRDRPGVRYRFPALQRERVDFREIHRLSFTEHGGRASFVDLPEDE